MLTRLSRFFMVILPWIAFGVMAGLTLILLSDNPTLTLFHYTFNKTQLCWLNSLVFVWFSYKERYYIKNVIERFVRWVKAL